jgi:2-dehydro-3-deoxyphosphogluconate aldolase/(4S)-4-hydroxy-2-oxoglutarate aldolase
MHLDVPVVGILRGVDPEFFGDMMKTSFEAGLQAIEVTMNTPGAERIISANRPMVPQGKLLGMGTIRNIEEARKAVDAGAMFIVTPNIDASVIEYAKQRTIPIICGALTPTEIYTAWSSGADMVKVFPCRVFGPQYIRDILGPFDRIPLVAVGGVTRSNVGAFFEAGAAAVGVGMSLFGVDAVRERQLEELGHNVKEFIESCSSGSDRT